MSVRLLGCVATALLTIGAQIATAQDGAGKACDPAPNGLVLQNCDPDCLWTASADGVFLTRRKPDSRPLVDDFNTGVVLASASDLHFNTAPGWDVDLTRHHVGGTCWDLEGVFSNVDSWNTSVGPMTVPTRTPEFMFATPITIPGASVIAVSDRTLLRSVELNARRDVGEYCSFLSGFRYIEFDDNLAINATALNGTAGQALVTANNYLAGGQIGGDVHFAIGNCWQFCCVAKAGAYCDRASNSSSVTVPLLAGGSAATTTNAAFVGQIEATVAYQINHAWSIRGGYQWMWLDGVAVAGNQLAVSNPFNGTAAVDTAGTPYFQGAFVGVEFWH